MAADEVPFRPNELNVLWGFLALVFGAAGVRGFLGAETTAGRIVATTLMLGLAGLAVFAAVHTKRHPGTLTVDDETIRSGFEGLPRSLELHKRDGELVFRLAGSWRSKSLYLTQDGTDVMIPMLGFGKADVIRIATDHGWRFRG